MLSKTIFRQYIFTRTTPNCFTGHLYVSFRPNEETDESDALAAMERCIDAIRNWIISNRLSMNSNKTEVLLIGTRQQLLKVNIDNVKVGSVNVAPSSPVKNLGVWFDSNLSMSVHKTKACSAAFYRFYSGAQARQARQQSTMDKIFREIYPCKKFGLCRHVRRSVQTVGVEVERQDSLWGRECSGNLAGNRAAALHLATRVFLAGNHISDEQRDKKQERARKKRRRN